MALKVDLAVDLFVLSHLLSQIVDHLPVHNVVIFFLPFLLFPHSPLLVNFLLDVQVSSHQQSLFVKFLLIIWKHSYLLISQDQVFGCNQIWIFPLVKLSIDLGLVAFDLSGREFHEPMLDVQDLLSDDISIVVFWKLSIFSFLGVMQCLPMIVNKFCLYLVRTCWAVVEFSAVLLCLQVLKLGNQSQDHLILAVVTIGLTKQFNLDLLDVRASVCWLNLRKLKHLIRFKNSE